MMDIEGKGEILAIRKNIFVLTIILKLEKAIFD